MKTGITDSSTGIEPHELPIRPTWDQTWLAAADVFSRRSLCSRSRVGAVIVDRENRVVASGYNGPPRGFNHGNRACVEWCERARAAVAGTSLLGVGYDGCPSLHAEANALSVCDRAARVSGTLYVTSHVCMDCAKLIANSGLSSLIVRSEPAPHRNPGDVYYFLFSCGINVDAREDERVWQSWIGEGNKWFNTTEPLPGDVSYGI